MSTDELLAACIAAPDDDAPRLVWADAVGGERGELVVVQCALARGGLTPQESAQLRRRQRELLAANGVAWSRLHGISICVTFRRGFVEAASIAYDRFVAQADDIFARAPLLQTLETYGFSQYNDAPPHPLERLRSLLATPAITQLRGVGLSGIYSYREQRNPGQYIWLEGEDLPVEDVQSEMTRYASDVIRELAQRLSHVRAFSTESNGLTMLDQARLANVERLRFGEYGTTDDLLRIFAAMPKLRALKLYPHHDLAAILPRLPVGIRELSLYFNDNNAHALSKMSCLSALERLYLSPENGTKELRDLSMFHAMPKLRSLILSHVPICDRADEAAERESVEHLLAVPMPALRELALFRSMAPANARRVLEVLGPQLESVDLGANRHLRSDRTLDALVAGEIVRGANVEHHSSFAVGGDAEPWNRGGDVLMTKP